jgi:hypothetical protein
MSDPGTLGGIASLITAPAVFWQSCASGGASGIIARFIESSEFSEFQILSELTARAPIQSSIVARQNSPDKLNRNLLLAPNLGFGLNSARQKYICADHQSGHVTKQAIVAGHLCRLHVTFAVNEGVRK